MMLYGRISVSNLFVFMLQTRLWQSLVVLTSFVDGTSVENDVRQILSHFTLNEAPSIKQYQEAAAAALLVKKVCNA